MPIPTQLDHAFAEVDDLHQTVLVRLRVWQRAGPSRDPGAIRAALRAYADKVVGIVNGDGQ
ncbi:hypothetical protein Bra471DRAFT_03989 [Bradyrhizobium sp. WSM471]|nr:hypothetical protein Bra471DRAFT_03989 [Bradyrhizobium sp. WSM471]